MPRIARFTRESKSTVYHVISRTALQGFPIRDVDKDYLFGLIKRLSTSYCVDVLAFAISGKVCGKIFQSIRVALRPTIKTVE